MPPLSLYQIIRDSLLKTYTQLENKRIIAAGLLFPTSIVVAEARNGLKKTQGKSHDMPGVSSYAGQMHECLQREDFDYARMYMADLVAAYKREFKPE